MPGPSCKLNFWIFTILAFIYELQLLLTPPNDIVLDLSGQVDEIGAVAGYPDDQVFILLWVLLSFQKQLFIQEIVLDMSNSVAEQSFGI